VAPRARRAPDLPRGAGIRAASDRRRIAVGTNSNLQQSALARDKFHNRARCCPRADGIDKAQAQSCTISGGGVTQTSGSCAITPGSNLTAQTAINANGGQITANGITVNYPNGGGIGAVAQTGGSIMFGIDPILGGSVIDEGVNGGGGNIALLANPTGQITATGLSINFGGAGGNVGAKAVNGGLISLNSTTVSYLAGGGGNTGIWATGAGSQVVATGTTVNMPGGGGGDTGVRADTGGAVTLNGGSIAVLGNGGGETGLLAQSTGSTITATGTVVTVSGGGGDAGVSATNGGSITTTGGSVSVVNGEGGLLQNGGSLTMSGTDVTASGNGGTGFLFNNGGNPNTLQYSGGTITASGASFSVQGATANINLSSTTAIANNNTLLETTSGGATLFNAQGSTLRGVISTQGGSTSTVDLTQGTVWTMTGNSTATNLTNSDSEIIYTAPTGDPTQLASYKTLTVSNYTGATGTLGLNTYLGADGSPSDRLLISGGTASGNSVLRITNIDGPGAETVSNGILVVQTTNGGTTAPAAFALTGEVRGGAFDYFLFRGGLNGSSPNDWFLRSSFNVGPIPPEPPIGPPEETLPPDPPPAGSLPPGTYPIIGPEIATYGVVQPIARELGQTTLGTLHERIGDTLTSVGGGRDGDGWGRSVWARAFGQQISATATLPIRVRRLSERL
jgi:hypothetical protein